jgi:pimeloyl-ACP methyl ester carboxylesterase
MIRLTTLIWLALASLAGVGLFQVKYRVQSLEQDLGQISVPTLIIWGDRDVIIPLDLGKRLHEKIPGAEFVVFENCFHIKLLVHF